MEMSCKGFLKFVGRVSLAPLALVSLTAFFLTTAFSADFGHPAGDLMPLRFEAVRLSTPALQCTNTSDETAKCWIILYCQVAIATQLPLLSTMSTDLPNDSKIADLASYLTQDRLERPPKSYTTLHF